MINSTSQCRASVQKSSIQQWQKANFQWSRSDTVGCNGTSFSSYTIHTDSVRTDELNHQYIVLDFWNSSCGMCFKKFLELQQLYNKFQNRENVLISSVFVKYNTDKTLEKGVEVIRKIGYTFPVYAIEENSSTLSLAGIKVYPTVLILDKDRKQSLKEVRKKQLESYICWFNKP